MATGLPINFGCNENCCIDSIVKICHVVNTYAHTHTPSCTHTHSFARIRSNWTYELHFYSLASTFMLVTRYDNGFEITIAFNYWNAFKNAHTHRANSSNELPDLHTTKTRAREVHASVIAEWLAACLLKLLPRGHQGATEENPEWKTFHTLSIFVQQTPFKF